MSSLPDGFNRTGFQFRVVYPEDGDGQPRGLSPRMTLLQFYDEWFLPVVLEGEVDVRKGTLSVYLDTLRWWAELTGNPPVELIDAPMLSDFLKKLRKATWKRGPLSKSYPLSEATCRKLFMCLGVVLRRLGPARDEDKSYADILPRSPRLKLKKLKNRPPTKPPIPLHDARLMFQATGQLPEAEGLFWRAALGLLYYAGLRKTELLLVERQHFQIAPEDCGGGWIRAPGAITKTGADLVRFVHPHAVQLLAELGDRPYPGALPSIETENRLLRWVHCPRHFNTVHQRLQKVAGLPGRYSPHAWRRTHATEIGRIGMGAMDAARRAMRHADSRTTRDHYVDLDAAIVLQLPRLDG